ncbi:MAG TPA: hypothetical protein PKA10_13675 [Selenomonadales bacterium]|nr:hypothetical protein [Selenomonadales bacterium]
MSPESILLAKIESLRSRIEHLRRELWEKDRNNIPDKELERQLEDLLIVYLHYIREHERIAA